MVDYLVKLDLTPENLQTALAKAAEKVKKERALLGELSAQENLAESVRSYQERFFVRLYAGLFPDEAALEQPLQHMELNLASDAYLVASCEIIANTALTPAQQLKLSFSCGRMLETTLQNYLPCYVTGADAMRCNVLFCLTDAQCQNYRTVLRPLLERASQILYNYFTVRLLWAVGRPTGSLLGLARRCRENAHLQPLLGKTDAGRCGGCIQFFAQLPQPAVRQIRRQRLCGVHHRDPHRCGKRDAGTGRFESIRDR